MIRVILLDLGETLVHGQEVIPHAEDALTALRRFTDTDGDPVTSALVSDFRMAQPPPTAASVKAIFDEYLGLLDGFGLRRFFRPVNRRITLSTHAGVTKPDRRVYETALRRLDVGAGLADCLVITEDAAHLQACRGYGMATLQFGKDFTTWLDGPLAVRRLVSPDDPDTARLALTPWFAAQGTPLVSIEEPVTATSTGARIRVRAAGDPPTARGRVTDVTVHFDTLGLVRDVSAPDPLDEERLAFVESLRAHGQLAEPGEELGPGQTHSAEVLDDGTVAARRGRFSSL